MYLKYFGQNTCCILCILTTKYKIQYKQSCVTTTRTVQCKITMSCHTKYKVHYCTKRVLAFSRNSCSKCSSVSQSPGRIMPAISIRLYEEYFLKLLQNSKYKYMPKCIQNTIQIQIQQKYLKYAAQYSTRI